MKITEKQLFNMAEQSPDIHPSAERLAQLLERDIDVSEREKLLDHLSHCSSCTLALQQVIELEDETHSFAEAYSDVNQTQYQKRNPWLGPVAVAASLFTCVLLLTVLMSDYRGGDHHTVRGESDQLKPAVGQALVAQPEKLVWQKSFDVAVNAKLMDEAARELWQSEPTKAGSVAVPSDLNLQPGTYFWQIYDPQQTVVAGPFWFEIQ